MRVPWPIPHCTPGLVTLQSLAGLVPTARLAGARVDRRLRGNALRLIPHWWYGVTAVNFHIGDYLDFTEVFMATVVYSQLFQSVNHLFFNQVNAILFHDCLHKHAVM